MNLSSGLFLLLLAAPGPCRAGQDPPQGQLTDEQKKAFNLLMQRFAQKQNIVAPPPVTPGLPPGQPPPTFEQQERERANEFDKQFGSGAYDGIVKFSAHCFTKDGCDKLATGQIIQGGYDFVSLQRDVEKKAVVPGSPEYAKRHGTIKDGMRSAVESFQPRPGGRSAYESELIRVSEPIVKKIFTPQELLKYAERNAAAADSAPYYSFLGKTLNAAGPPGRARQAFDAALQRDPKDEGALSGRAEASLKMGDYTGAVSDARAALSLDPGDARAMTTLRFAEGRAGGAAAAAPAAAAFPISGAGETGPLSSEARAALDRAGDGSRIDAARRSGALVTEARRSLGLGDPASAAALLRRAIELDPTNASAFSLAAMSYLRLKNYAEALSAAAAGLKLAPGSAALLDAKAFALNHMKDYRGALDASARALEANPRDAMGYFNRAAALGGSGDREGMLAALRSAAGIDPKFTPVLDQALELPNDGDILFLFPGERPTLVPAAPAPRAGARARLLLGGGLLLGLLAALVLIRGLKRRDPVASAVESLPAVPRLLAGNFEVGHEIGSGGMGVVFDGLDRSLDRRVAIKRMREEIRWDPRERARFVAEARLVARLKHPNIVSIQTIVEEGGEVYLVFERVEGKTLRDLIARDGKLPFDRARDLFRGVAAALDFAHDSAVIHRDLKPANIMVDGQGRAKVMDFGIARLAEEVVSRHSRTTGTPLYMAPEQEQGVSRRESDVYSLALCLFEAVTGQSAFSGTGAGLLMNKIKASYEPASARGVLLPAAIDAVFARALDPDPEKRYARAGDLVRALEALELPRAA